jgi:hypothetical protein
LKKGGGDEGGGWLGWLGFGRKQPKVEKEHKTVGALRDFFQALMFVLFNSYNFLAVMLSQAHFYFLQLLLGGFGNLFLVC